MSSNHPTTSDPVTIDPVTIDEAIRRAVVQRPDALALADAPNRTAFFDGPAQRFTWSELDNAVDNLAASLRGLGVGLGTAVAIQLPNVVELVITLFACGRLRATAVPFPIQHRRHELEAGLTASNARVIVTGARPDRPDQLETIAALAADLSAASGQRLAVATFGSETVEGGSRLDLDIGVPARMGEADEAGGARADDVVTICWTSGTTGAPRGVPRTASMWLASGQFQVDELELDLDDRMLCPFPIVNMAGIGGMVVPWVLAGATLHLHQPLDLQVFLGQISSEAITYTVAPPPLLNMLLANEAILDTVDLSAVRKIASGSAPLDPSMVAGWDRRGIEIVNLFGSNEGAAMLATKATVPDPSERARFFALPKRDGVDVRIVDFDTGLDITEAGHPGELRFGGPTVFAGYLDSTGDEFDERGAYRTGDVFEWGDDTSDPRKLRFIDRAKDIIIRGGMNISAAELEGLIASSDEVAECAVVAFPDATLGERVGVFVVAAPGAEPTIDSVVEHLRGLDIASYKLPEKIEVVTALPRNPVGKVTKADLRSRWS